MLLAEVEKESKVSVGVAAVAVIVETIMISIILFSKCYHFISF